MVKIYIFNILFGSTGSSVCLNINLHGNVHLQPVSNTILEVFPQYYIESDIINSIISSTTHWCVTAAKGFAIR